MTKSAVAVSFGLLTGTITADSIERLEALPFDSLWVGGHVASDNPSPEALMQLAQLAALSRRVRVGTAVLLLPLYPPAILAKQVADLDRASGGRVILGVGVGGEYPKEFEACGVPLEERGSRTDEGIALLRHYWTGEPVTHAGRHHSVDGVRIHPPPSQRPGPPIVVAGRGRPAMRRAAALGDGWMPYLYSPERYERSVTEINKFADERERPLDRFSWMVFVFVNVQDTVEQARADASGFLGGNFRQDVNGMLDRVAAVGTADRVAGRLRAYADAGAEHVILVPATRDDPLGQAQRLATEVLPLVPHGECPVTR